jgi:hypothetical protein
MDRAGVEIVCEGWIARRPPLVELRARATLANPRARPRWFLLPSSLDAAGRWTAGGVSSVAVYAGRGAAGACVASFAGTGGFHAVLVAARATVTIEGLPIERWGAAPEAVDFDVVTARGLSIDGRPAESWLAPIPASPNGSTLRYDPVDLQTERIAPDGEEHAVTLDGEERIAVHLDLTAGAP